MDDSAAQVRLTLSIAIDPALLIASSGTAASAGAVITFSYEEDGMRCDGEISLRLSLAD